MQRTKDLNLQDEQPSDSSCLLIAETSPVHGQLNTFPHLLHYIKCLVPWHEHAKEQLAIIYS